MFALSRAFDAEERGLAGSVTVTATESLTVPFLIRNLPLLEQRHPGIRLHLVNEYRILNLCRPRATLATGLAQPDRETPSIRRTGPLASAPYASPTHIVSHDAPSVAGDRQTGAEGRAVAY